MVSGSHHIVASPLIQNAFGDCGRSFIAVQKGAEAELGSWFGQSWNDNVATRSPVPGEDKLEAIEAVFERVPHAEITVAGFAVSYANLKPATFSSTSNGYQVEGKPLCSFDFRGYDSVKPHLLSRYQGLEPRILLSQVPSLTQVCDEYRARIESSRPPS
jgi:hypothetical protein